MDTLERKSFVVSAAAFTDAGRVRKNNQDYIAYHIPKEVPVNDVYGALLLVCDGVGGHSAGEIASEHAGRRILNDYYQAPAEQPALTRLVAAIQQANADILQENAGQPETRMMTTTVVAAVIEGSHLHLAHVGDSRAYLIRAGQITQLTADHSWVAEMVRAGELTAEEAQQHPWRNRITRSLGLKERLAVDAQTAEVGQGDVVFLCSDGLTRHVADAEIAETVTRQPAHAAAQTLVNLAKARGGTDNISVIVAQLLTPDMAQPLAGLVAQPRSPGAPQGPPRHVLPWLPLALVAGVLLLLVASVLIYTQTDLLRPSSFAAPTPAGAADAMPADTPVPTLASVATDAPTPLQPTPDPTSTSRPTPTPTAISSQTPAATATAATTDSASASTPAPRLTTLLTYAPTPAHTLPASATLGAVPKHTPIPTIDYPTAIPTKNPTHPPTRSTGIKSRG